MTSAVYFDYCALIVEVLIIVSLVLRKMTRGRLNRWAFVLISDIIVTTVAAILALTLEAKGSGYTAWKYIANTVYLWGLAQTSAIFCGYIYAFIGIWHKIRTNRKMVYFYNIPIVFLTVLILLVNPFTKLVFSIDKNGRYTRGPLLFLVFAIAVLYMAAGCFEMAKHRRLFSFRKIFSVYAVFAMMVFSMVIQVILPAYSVNTFFLAAAFLVMLFGVQSPEERMHGATGLFSMNAYVQDICRYKELGTPIAVTLSVMKNYNSLIEMLGFFTVQDIIGILAKRLEDWAAASRVDADLYYLGGGRYAVIVDERYEKNMITISQEVNAELVRDVDLDGMQVKVMNNVCFINCPKDIDDPQFMFSFDGRLEVEAFTGELRYAEKLFDKKRFELRRDISKVIDRAFEKKLFYLEYQPVFSVKDNRFVRAEAFLRLNDPDYGYIRPDLLIAEAERLNAIHAITTYVIEEVCRFISMPDFLLLGLDYLEINLSPAQCMWNDLLGVLLSTVRNYNVQPKSICFNITDVDSQEMYKRMHDNIEALSQVGFGIFMDDFGAGIFEVERIAKMPLSGIKLDRSFVREGLKCENTAVFTGSLGMIKDLEIDAVAVGVEDEETAGHLAGLGCNYLQGYHYCRPLDKKELIRFILMS